MENNPHVVPSTENTKPRHFGDGSQFPPLQRPWEGRRLGTPELQALLFCSRGLNSAVGPQLTAVCKPLKPLPGNIPSYRTPLAEQLTERPQHTGKGLLLVFTAKAGGAGHPSPPGVKLPPVQAAALGLSQEDSEKPCNARKEDRTGAGPRLRSEFTLLPAQPAYKLDPKYYLGYLLWKMLSVFD